MSALYFILGVLAFAWLSAALGPAGRFVVLSLWWQRRGR
jgi:hypothetical protein